MVSWRDIVSGGLRVNQDAEEAHSEALEPGADRPLPEGTDLG